MGWEMWRPFPEMRRRRVLNLFSPLLCLSSLSSLVLNPCLSCGGRGGEEEGEEKSFELGTGDFHLWRCVVVVAWKDSRLLTSERFILEEVGGKKKKSS